jgi:hypothetical protein
MPKRLVFIAVSVTVLVAATLLGLYFLSVGGRLIHPYPASSNYALLSIHELKQGDHPSGSFYNTEGYVAKVYTCPFCPPGAACAPCMEEHIVISEQSKTLDTEPLTDLDLVVFVSYPKQFSLMQKYTFSIRIRDYSVITFPGQIDAIELVGYSP